MSKSSVRSESVGEDLIFCVRKLNEQKSGQNFIFKRIARKKRSVEIGDEGKIF